MFKRSAKPLYQCEILHQLPGRVRIRCRALGFLADQVHNLREDILESPAVTSCRITPITENVLIHYASDESDAESMVEHIESALSPYLLEAYKRERTESGTLTVNERRLQEEDVGGMLGRVAVTTASLLFFWLWPGPSASKLGLIRRFLTMPALTSLSLAAPIFRSGWRSIAESGRPNADTLSATAILASLVSGRDGSAMTIIWLADIAELLTAYSMRRARGAIREMLSVGEDYVCRLRPDGTEQRVALAEVRPGDRIMVPTGEKISVDGTVESGDAAVDQASITGEFMPVRKNTGQAVFAGTLVKSGSVVIRAERVGDQTAVARIIQMVEEATHHRAHIQNIADRISAQFIPMNFLLAGVVYFVTRKPARALNMLIIDYSCGVRLSTATALAAAICTAARNRVLIKGGNYLEMLAEADTLIFDKTGTLTEGRAIVSTTLPTSPAVTKDQVLALAAAAEQTSSHPMAVAILEKARGKALPIPGHSNTRVCVARGVQTTVNGNTIRVGNRRFMEESAVELAAAADVTASLARRGENIVYVARDAELIGVLGIQDALRENMKKALNRLRHTGMDDIIMLTGDVEQHAEIVAHRMALDRYHAEALPEHKAEMVLRLQSKGVHVVMVGDGINDAPALAYATVGIAMGGTRTHLAMEAADITIAGDDPLMIPAVVRLAQKTMGIIRQNFITAIGVNTLGLVLSSVGVLPVFWGAVLHNACTVAVVGNSSRLLFHDVERRK